MASQAYFERRADHAIHDVFLERWSPRSFDGSSLGKTDVMRLLEAARWAPSAFNSQPWRFLYSLRDDAHWGRFLNILLPANREWAARSSAIVFVLSDGYRRDESGAVIEPAYSSSFDTGAAWGQMALQAVHVGLHTHAIAGLDYEAAQRDLAVPDGMKVEIAVAVGRICSGQGMLSEALQEREMPSDRRKLASLAFAGPFPDAAGAT